MLVIFISASVKKARLPVAQILDAYAYRTGNDCWTAHMTEKGLETVRVSLIKASIKGTSVMCRKISGFSHKHQPVQWIIGQKNRFAEENGYFSVMSKSNIFTHQRHVHSTMVHELSLWANMAGTLHDLGKNNQAFQDKIKNNQHTSDRVRHEIFSTYLMNTQYGNEIAEASRFFDLNTNHYLSMDFSSPMEIIRWAVSAHHRLPGKVFNDHLEPVRFSLGAENHISDKTKQPEEEISVDNGNFPLYSSEKISLKNLESSVDYVSALGFYLRWGLMIGDHFVSGLDPDEKPACSVLKHRIHDLLNNTDYQDYRAMANGKQRLRNHLDAVGFAAGWATRYLMKGRLRKVLPEIESGTISDQVGRSGRYAWQGAAIDSILSKELDEPVLCLVLSSTGSGKTHACLGIADALCQKRGQGLRAHVVLGLRTLTLQTGDVYREKLNISKDQLSVVIGSQVARDLHTASRDEENANETIYETDGSRFWSNLSHRLPPLISGEFSRKSDDSGFLLSPLLVSTIDQMIPAADLRRAGWIKPMLRLSTGPLIIDEIDNYDLKDLIPVLRLIYFAGMVGQDVICSTATLYPAIAEAIIEAHAAGCKQRKNLFNPLSSSDQQKESVHHVAFFSNTVSHPLWVEETQTAFKFYQDFCRESINVSEKDTRRQLSWLPDYPKESAVWEDLGRQVEILHENHQWESKEGVLSIGMMRFAHVREVMKAAKVLSTYQSDKMHLVIVPYHSKNFMLSRAFIEYRLDGMLQRSENSEAMLKDMDVQRCLSEAKRNGKSLCIVVVCSPVEEVGRDHDFDWGIIEPSSTRSIVQAAGRILRHRFDQTPTVPNVYVFRKPVRYLRSEYDGKAVYNLPGFETQNDKMGKNEDTSNYHRFAKYHHDMPELLDIPDGNEVVHGGWCMHPERPMPIIEDEKIREYTKNNFHKAWIDEPTALFCAHHFNQFKFRDNDYTEACYLDSSDDTLMIRNLDENGNAEKRVEIDYLNKSSLLFSESYKDVLAFWMDRLSVDDEETLCKKYMHINLRKDEKSVDLMYGVFYDAS